MDVQRFFKVLIEIESRLAELYAWFSEAYAEDAEAAALFYRMSRDEKSHVALIQYERRLLRKEKDLSFKVELSPKELEDTACEVGKLLLLRSAPPMPEALALALRFENSAAENHMDGVEIQEAPGLSRLLKSLGKEDRRHYSDLVALARKRGIAAP
jgi:rubrerythrin